MCYRFIMVNATRSDSRNDVICRFSEKPWGHFATFLKKPEYNLIQVQKITYMNYVIMDYVISDR